MRITDYNKTIFNVDLSGMKFYSLSEIVSELAGAVDLPLEITGLFINRKSKFGEQAFISTPYFCVDLPAHMLAVIKNMIQDPQVVEEIKAGKAAFDIESYEPKNYKGTTAYTIRFCENKK